MKQPGPNNKGPNNQELSADCWSDQRTIGVQSEQHQELMNRSSTSTEDQATEDHAIVWADRKWSQVTSGADRRERERPERSKTKQLRDGADRREHERPRKARSKQDEAYITCRWSLQNEAKPNIAFPPLKKASGLKTKVNGSGLACFKTIRHLVESGAGQTMPLPPRLGAIIMRLIDVSTPRSHQGASTEPCA